MAVMAADDDESAAMRRRAGWVRCCQSGSCRPKLRYLSTSTTASNETTARLTANRDGCLVFSDGQISDELMGTASVSVRIAGSRGKLGAVTACCWLPFLCSPDAGAALGCLSVGRFDRGVRSRQWPTTSASRCKQCCARTLPFREGNMKVVESGDSASVIEQRFSVGCWQDDGNK